MDVSWSGKVVRVGDREWMVPYPVVDARRVGDVVVVLYDYMAGPRHCQFQNLEGYDEGGRRLWTAAHPTNMTADAYVSISTDKGLRAWNFACYECELDPRTGRLVKAEFTK